MVLLTGQNRYLSIWKEIDYRFHSYNCVLCIRACWHSNLNGKFEGRIDDLQVKFVAQLNQKNLPNLAIESEVMDNETHRTIFGPGFTNGMRFLYQQGE